MSLGDDLTRDQSERFKWREDQRKKCGEYTGGNCPNCGRQRVMSGADGKRRCEKCAWCIEDNGYDGDLLEYLH